jgi:hypothetical protein
MKKSIIGLISLLILSNLISCNTNTTNDQSQIRTNAEELKQMIIVHSSNVISKTTIYRIDSSSINFQINTKTIWYQKSGWNLKSKNTNDYYSAFSDSWKQETKYGEREFKISTLSVSLPLEDSIAEERGKFILTFIPNKNNPKRIVTTTDSSHYLIKWKKSKGVWEPSIESQFLDSQISKSLKATNLIVGYATPASQYKLYNDGIVSFEYASNWKPFPSDFISQMKQQMDTELREYNREIITLQMVTSPTEDAALFISKTKINSSISTQDLFVERQNADNNALKTGYLVKINTLEIVNSSIGPMVVEDVERNDGQRAHAIKIIISPFIYEVTLAVSQKSNYEKNKAHIEHVTETFKKIK